MKDKCSEGEMVCLEGVILDCDVVMDGSFEVVSRENFFFYFFFGGGGMVCMVEVM